VFNGMCRLSAMSLFALFYFFCICQRIMCQQIALRFETFQGKTRNTQDRTRGLIVLPSVLCRFGALAITYQRAQRLPVSSCHV
jgi:hypothetical protein